MKKILVGVMGSRAFGIEGDNSDQDKLGIFISSNNERLKRNFTPYLVEDNALYYEIGYYCDLLEQGDIQAIQLLFLDNYSHYHSWCGWLHDIKDELLTSTVLQKWMNLSSLYYSRALRIGSMVMNDKHPIEFLTMYHMPLQSPEALAEPMSKIVARGTWRPDTTSDKPLDINRIGLSRLRKNFYSVFYDYQCKGTVNGLFDSNGKLIENGVLSASFANYLGVLHYDEEKYRQYTKLKNFVKASRVAQGYATKSMMHAFVVIEQVLGFLETRTLRLRVKEPEYYKMIRKGEVARTDLAMQYKELYRAAQMRLQDYDKQPDPTLITNLLDDIRTKYENSKTNEVEHRWPL